jgi:hypothetical protein
MRRMLFLVLFLVLCFVALPACLFSRQTYRPDQKYLAGLSAMNFELWGDLSLVDYAEDFSALTYEDYIARVAEETNNTDVLSKINAADEHCFSASKNYFIVCLKYAAEGYAVCDNASTSKLDSIEKTGKGHDLKRMMNAMEK